MVKTSKHNKKNINSIVLSSHEFEIALSYPREYESTVEQIAIGLKDNFGENSIFFAKWYEGELTRLNLDDVLQNIYEKQSKLIVVFLCPEYEKKEWCGLEWRAIKNLIKSRNDEAIMLVKLENFKISLKGLFGYDGYLNIKNKDPKEVVTLIIKRYFSMSINSPKITGSEKSKNIPKTLENSSKNYKEVVEILCHEATLFANQGIMQINGIIKNKSDKPLDVFLSADVYDGNIKIGRTVCNVDIDPYGQTEFSFLSSGLKKHLKPTFKINIESVRLK
jgi:hypothetical protein